MLHTLSTNIDCPGCGHTTLHFTRNGDRVGNLNPVANSQYVACRTQGCKYYDIFFKMPTIQLEITEEGRQLLEEREIMSKDW